MSASAVSSHNGLPGLYRRNSILKINNGVELETEGAVQQNIIQNNLVKKKWMSGISHRTFFTYFKFYRRILNNITKVVIKRIQSDIEVMGMHSGTVPTTNG